METILLAFSTATAKDTSVGGTSNWPKLPDIESFPPIAGSPKSLWAWYAPSNAANGLPHLDGLLPNLSKYSWNVNLIFL